jgi:hypothetical protein
MDDNGREELKPAAAAGAGVGVGGAGGPSVGGIAALGTATGLTAGAVIGVGIAVGTIVGLAGYGVYRLLKKWAPASTPDSVMCLCGTYVM